MFQFMESLSHSRLLFYVSLTALSVCGVTVIAMDIWSKGSSQQFKHSLNRGLWKFETKESIECRNVEKVWAWRKLCLAGVMISSVFVTILSKILTAMILIVVSSVFLMIWMLFLMYYWYFIIVPGSSDSVDMTVNTERPSESRVSWSNKIKNSRKDEDRRLPVTIVTGFLGSGKTTLVKGILSNGAGLRVLVIENEIGAEGIDHDLLLQHTAREEIVLMSNGCVCCTGECVG